METSEKTIESQIADVLNEIHQLWRTSPGTVSKWISTTMANASFIQMVYRSSSSIPTIRWRWAGRLWSWSTSSQRPDGRTRRSLTVNAISRYKKLATRDQLCIWVKETKRQGRIAHHHTDATVPHIVALLGFSFHAANIRRFFVTSKYYGIYFMFWAEIGGRIQPCDWIKLCNIGTVLLLHDNEEQRCKDHNDLCTFHSMFFVFCQHLT